MTTLFYIDGYTQADIGDFLEVPVSTVNKRLYSARQRLKSNVVELFKSDLHQQRPSRDANFSNEVNTKLRPFHDPDWPTVSAIASARASDDEPGHELWLRGRQKFDESRYFRRHYVVENAARQTDRRVWRCRANYLLCRSTACCSSAIRSGSSEALASYYSIA